MKKYWIFNCRDVSRLVSDSMDRSLPLKTRLGIRFHLMMCRYCTRYEQQLKKIRLEIRKHTTSTEPPHHALSDDQKRRIRDKLKSHLDKD